MKLSDYTPPIARSRKRRDTKLYTKRPSQGGVMMNADVHLGMVDDRTCKCGYVLCNCPKVEKTPEEDKEGFPIFRAFDGTITIHGTEACAPGDVKNFDKLTQVARDLGYKGLVLYRHNQGPDLNAHLATDKKRTSRSDCIMDYEFLIDGALRRSLQQMFGSPSQEEKAIDIHRSCVEIDHELQTMRFTNLNAGMQGNWPSQKHPDPAIIDLGYRMVAVMQSKAVASAWNVSYAQDTIVMTKPNTTVYFRPTDTDARIRKKVGSFYD